MLKFFRTILLFFLPSCILCWLFSIKARKKIKNVHIGFSIIYVDTLEIEDNIYIGNGNKILIHSLKMKQGSRINKKNSFFGKFSIQLNKEAVISRHNKFNSDNSPYTNRVLSLGENTIIVSQHSFDVTRSIIIGDNSIFAGSNSQVWTHSFYHSKNGKDRWRVDSEVNIGNNVYVGSMCVICPGVTICDSTHIGAAVCVSKSLIQPGLYVNQPLRYIEMDPDEAVKKYRVVQETPFVIVEK